ncbi:MAG: hypothetical protein JXB42_01730 [Deltaproteobacteria bacterium]|nr:hypothetical protein [Deltaproteobacteria bacterium]
MSRKFTGKNGVLRIYDSTDVLHGTAPRDDATVQIKKYNGVDTWADITDDVKADDTSVATAFLADNAGEVYVGSSVKFARIKYLKGNGSNYAAGSGTLLAWYYNGSAWTALTVDDGTESGGDCFAKDGVISFAIPKDWALRGNINLSTTRYYIKLMTTDSPSTDPDADVLCPVDGQYREVIFAAMDFNGPIGRPKTEEKLVLNRGNMDANAHYIEGSDEKIHEPLEIGFSCLLDDSANKDYIFTALACGNPDDSARWTAAGESSKGTTKNDGTNYNPAFADTTKKTVNVQILFTGETYNEGWSYYETFFPEEGQSMSESEEAVTLSCKGGVYGVIERIHEFGNRY